MDAIERHVADRMRRIEPMDAQEYMNSLKANYPIGAEPIGPKITKREVVNEVASTVCGPRQEAYGNPEDNFQRIAALWTVHFRNRHALDIELDARDVAMLMLLMKVARLQFRPDHHDSWIDAAGYAVNGAAL